MSKGMTGFGSAQTGNGEFKAVVEIKSLNHRYFDLSFYLPPGFGVLENKIRQLIQKKIHRGRVTLAIKITQTTSYKYSINKTVVKEFLKSAKMLKKEFGLNNDLSIADLIKLPGVIESRENKIDIEKMWPLFEKSIKKAVEGVEVMRKKEGQSLASAVKKLLVKMSSHIKKIEKRSSAVIRSAKKTLNEEELKSFLKGIDVNEEVSRLSHYISEMSALFKTTVSVGKKMDFIAQEMQRETNTIGSKMQDKIVSSCVISLKSYIEKIRELSQNIE